MKKVNIILLLFLLPFFTLGQNTIGLPDVTNFKKETYLAGLQNWEIKQDNNGIMYFANNEGLLSFDGTYWNLTPLPNKTIVRSIEIAKDNNIYAGGQDELGYYKPGRNGQLEFYSMVGLIPKNERAFGDVWDVVCTPKDIFFRTTKKIFRFSGNNVSIYKAPSEWSFMNVCNNEIYAHDYEKGLMIFKNETWAPVQFSNQLAKNDPVTGIVQLSSGSTLISTLKNGIFRMKQGQFEKINSPTLSSISKERIYACSKVNKEWMALATNNGGLYIVDLTGNLIQKFSKREGLQNNNILSVFLDLQGNLWLGLDNGIDCIAYNSAIKHILPNELENSGYATIIHNNEMFIGTSGGLYSTPLNNIADLSFSKGNFSEIANTSGQVWGLAEINNQLLLGHHEGAFIINHHQANPIATGDGYWNFAPMEYVFPSKLNVAGYYKGLRFIQSDGENFIPANALPNFEESSRYLAIDNNQNIWVSHPYHGVYKINESKNAQYAVQLFTDKNGLPKLLNNQVYKIKNQIVVATEKGVYKFNDIKNIFEPDGFYTKILGELSIRYLKEDTDGNIWFIHEKNLGVIDLSGKEPRIINIPELSNKMLSGFEFIYAVNANNIFMGGEKGFYHINYEKYKNLNTEIKIRLRSVKINNLKDSTLFGGYFSPINEMQKQTKELVPRINYNWKNIHFEYAGTVYGQVTNLQYAYYLKGFDNGWSEWSDKTEKDYTNLPPGHYDFMVKVRNNLGKESAPITYSFKINSPWYRSNWAYTIYLLAFLLFLYMFYARQRKKLYLQQAHFEEEQKKTNYLHQLEINKAETAIINLRNEKLQSEIDFKNSELATNAMHLVQKGEILTKIKSELQQIMKGIENEKVLADLKKMIKVLGEDEKMDKDWEHFAQHFDKVHSDFVALVKHVHPAITPNELKLCTYLRMNLSTKEIAQLMNISVRGVEISRYRLRKKLGIATEMSLFDYLISLTDNK